jgi:RHS repeat-associated protein
LLITGGALTATYGPDGLRATKTATPVGGSAAVTSYFVYDGETPLLEETAGGQVLAANGLAGDGWRQRYYPGTSSLPAPYNAAPYAASGGGGQYYAYTYDPQGSLVQRQAAGNGQSDATDTVAYDGYGARLGDVDSTTGMGESYSDPVGFGGQWGYYGDAETGLELLTHRYYDSGAGRFLSRDPSGYQGGPNLYGFADDNPINYADPTGFGALAPFAASRIGGGHQKPGVSIVAWLAGLFDGRPPAGVYGTGFGSEQDLQNEADADHLDDPAHVQYMDAYGKLRARNNKRSRAYQQKMSDAANVAMMAVPGPGEEAGAAEGFTIVGRWMHPEELEAMEKTGMVQESWSGTTFVAHPADINAYGRQAKTSQVYVEFEVPSSSIVQTKEGWGKILGPNSLQGRMAARKGLPIPQMPAARNITPIETKLRYR